MADEYNPRRRGWNEVIRDMVDSQRQMTPREAEADAKAVNQILHNEPDIDCPDTADPKEWGRLSRSDRLIWAWWRTKRPAGYDATLHRKYPTINVHADAGEELARHAARISRIIGE